MPDLELIEEWKIRYGGVYQIEDFIFRGISIGEYKTISSLKLSSAEVEEHIVLLAILDPIDITLDDLPAGVVTAIAEQVTHISGFGDPKVAKNLLTTKREKAETVFTLMKAMILIAMPAYKEEELDALPFPSLLERVVLAERIIDIQQTIARGDTIELDLIDPEEEEQKAKQAASKHNTSRKSGQAVHGDPIADKLRRALG